MTFFPGRNPNGRKAIRVMKRDCLSFAERPEFFENSGTEVIRVVACVNCHRALEHAGWCGDCTRAFRVGFWAGVTGGVSACVLLLMLKFKGVW